MARPKSEDKRNAILSAATRVFAERGLGAATSAISNAGGVAEGTLFTYFKTKDDLVNELYRQIKLELADAMMSGFPRKKSVRHRLQHIWDCFVNWGVANPEQRKVLAQLEVSDRLSLESKRAGSAPFLEIQTMAQDAITQHVFQDLPQEFVAAVMRALAETTMEFMASNPKAADKYRQLGFAVLWAGIIKKK
jgi:AcrR family transcriptional regulator